MIVIKRTMSKAVCNTTIWLIMLLLMVGGCTTQALNQDADQMGVQEDAEKWGIRFESIRLTGADHFVDFRFRVIDPLKAGNLLSRKDAAYLLHEPTGKAFPVPVTKVGPLRATAVGPKPGRSYVILVSNVNKIIQQGDPVTVVIGEFKTAGLRIGTARDNTPDLTPEQDAAWKDQRRDLLHTYQACMSECLKDRACLKQCREDYDSGLNAAYLNILDD
ncbi:hypothetical protein [Desulfosarcina sp.]|uniref:hypothetical protein n=1 Tax=Desulfosarcina sp. TaxID=2027861 RepID=UPI00356B444A